MIVVRTAKELEQQTGNTRSRIGFVPTMGALHAGHLSLIEASKTIAGLTVCSIFVNPAQFNDPADYDKYPITTDKDIQLLEQAGADVLFLPSLKEIYPNGTANLEKYALGFLETVLEGKYRPGHFQGVCQVMNRLLNAVKPAHLFMGQKDYQQCMVVRKLMQLTGIENHTQLHVCETVREPDGLAMSSRNMRLNEAERTKAVMISAALRFVKQNIRPGNITQLTARAIASLMEAGFKVDYLEIADADTLELLTQWDGKRKAVVLVAAFLNDVRLIDNMLIN